MDGTAATLRLLSEDKRRRYPVWVTILFGLLCLVNLAPLVLLAFVGGFTQAAWRDPSFPPSLAVVCAAALVAIAGVIGACRGWNAIVLSLFGLVMIVWPLFVAWVLLNMIAAAL